MRLQQFFNNSVHVQVTSTVIRMFDFQQKLANIPMMNPTHELIHWEFANDCVIDVVEKDDSVVETTALESRSGQTVVGRRTQSLR